MKCVHCGKEIDDKSKFCKYCGGITPEIKESKNPQTGVKKFKCQVCGAELNPGVKFCTKCGTPIIFKDNKDKVKKKSKGKKVLIIIIIIVVIATSALSVMFGMKFIRDKDNVSEFKKTEALLNEEANVKDKKDDSFKKRDEKNKLEENIKVVVKEEEKINDPLNDEDAYIVPESNQKYLTEDDLKGLTAQELNYAKNEIYARHGRLFLSNELQTYFDSKIWYTGLYSADVFDGYNLLSDLETKNAELIRNMEYSLEPEGYPLDK